MTDVDGVDRKTELLKFCSPNDYSLANLQSSVIYCQHYARFNDPFEFWAEFRQGIPDEATEPERFEAASREWGYRSPAGIDDPDTAAYFEEMLLYEPPFENMLGSTRVACFGSEIDNLLMWSHYADGLRGFCIVFDKAAVVGGDRNDYVVDVAYKRHPPVVDSFVYAIAWDQQDYHLKAVEETELEVSHAGKTDEDRWLDIYQDAADEALLHMRQMWQQVFGTKPLAWKYERERRLLMQTSRDDEEPVLRPYPRTAIKEIIFGERMPADYLARLRAVASEIYGNVPLRVARRSNDSYSLIIE